MAVMDQHLETFYSADVDMNGIQSHVSLWLTARTFTGALINGLYQQTVLGPYVCVCISVCVCRCVFERACVIGGVCSHARGILIRTKCVRTPQRGRKTNNLQ